MSSPMRPGASLEEELDYYKRQYEQLETDLADFQASSKELEEQLERDIEAAEKNERKLKEQIEKLRYEAEEWKSKHQQSKTESNSAQNALQKEITAMRDANRTLQMKLRDIEVANDDYERQARNTESSLEDMESKCNVAIERSVLLESEMKSGEQEREDLRIETQRLRDELGDLKIESDITLSKLRQADETIERLRSRKPSPLAVESLRARSPGSEASGATPASPTASTPPPKSDSASEAPTPPSPPLSDVAANTKPEPKTPLPPTKRKSSIPDPTATPRIGVHSSRTLAKHTRGPSIASNGGVPATDSKAMRPPPRPRQTSRPSMTGTESLPRSDSLYQIRNLRGRMQKIEERVHSARAKLPASAKDRTPKGSPVARAILNDNLPASVTMRRSIKRPSSHLGSLVDGSSDAASDTNGRRESRISRLSFGIPRPTSLAERPASALDRPPSAAGISRPSSRASVASASANLNIDRPGSRSGALTPLGGQFPSTTSNLPSRPSSGIAGNYATIHGTPRSRHRPSASVNEFRRMAAESEDSGFNTSPSARRSTLDKSMYGTIRRQSNAAAVPTPKTVTKRTSTGLGLEGPGAMKPPPSRRKMSDVGETY